MQQDPLLRPSLSGAEDVRCYAASDRLDGASIASPEIFPAARIAPRASSVIGNNPATALVGPDLVRFAEAVEMPAGSAKDALHAQIRDGCDGLKAALLAPFDHCGKQQERPFPQAVLCCSPPRFWCQRKSASSPRYW